MRSGKCDYLSAIFFAITAAVITGAGCRKENAIVNNNVIRTPYGVYIADQQGALYNTNDGEKYKTLFTPDGIAPRAITISGNNIIWVKRNLHVSQDNGQNFNPTNYTVAPLAKGQNLILNVPSMERVYLASTKGLGVEYSTDNGITWESDNSIGQGSPSPMTPQSFTQLKNGWLFSLDGPSARFYIKMDKLAPWVGFTSAGVSPLPGGARYLSHINNTLLAADYNGAGGIYYSADTGLTWTQYAGTPTNQEILSVVAPFDQVVLAGTDSAGIYRLVGNTFQPSNNGLKPFTSVYAIAGKQDTYKSDIIKQYIYIATNNGLYRSEDLGQNWTLVKTGDYRTIY